MFRPYTCYTITERREFQELRERRRKFMAELYTDARTAGLIPAKGR